jgi:hypothetical protein
MKKNDNSYDEYEHRKELVTEGMNMPKEKIFMNPSASKLKKTSDHRNSLSKEEISYSAQYWKMVQNIEKKKGP